MTLAQINIHSSFDLITWGGLRPNFITDVIPTVVEIILILLLLVRVYN